MGYKDNRVFSTIAKLNLTVDALILFLPKSKRQRYQYTLEKKISSMVDLHSLSTNYFDKEKKIASITKIITIANEIYHQVMVAVKSNYINFVNASEIFNTVSELKQQLSIWKKRVV